MWTGWESSCAQVAHRSFHGGGNRVAIGGGREFRDGASHDPVLPAGVA
ncbi:hypothetical protein WEI85_47140 [Actinomycetes bacterium KLBMP 9797]